MTTFARMTGGRSYAPRLMGELPDIFREVAQAIRNQYTITYKPTNTKQDGTYRKLKVELVGPGRQAAGDQGREEPRHQVHDHGPRRLHRQARGGVGSRTAAEVVLDGTAGYRHRTLITLGRGTCRPVLVRSRSICGLVETGETASSWFCAVTPPFPSAKIKSFLPHLEGLPSCHKLLPTLAASAPAPLVSLTEDEVLFPRHRSPVRGRERSALRQGNGREGCLRAQAH